MLKTMTVRTAIAAILAGLSMSAHAAADTARAISVPAGDLVAALESLANQAEIELVYQPEELRGIHTAGVNGTYEPKEAVALLLKGTQLTIRTDKATGVMLVAPPAPKVTSIASEEHNPIRHRLQLAQSDTPSPPRADGRDEAEAPRLEEVVVTGSLVVRDGNAMPTPVTVVDAEALQQSAPSSIPDGLNQLPQFSNSRSQAQSNQTGTAVTPSLGNYLNLRNLGFNRGLILLDGQRVPPTSYEGIVDTNVLPQALIQRVDVVTAGASATYGSDAVTGVVNFVLDKKFTGLKGTVQSGTSEYGDNDSYRIQVAGGMPILSDRGHLLVSAEHFQSDGIKDKADRPLFSSFPCAYGNGTTVPYRTEYDCRYANVNNGGVVQSGPFINQTFNPDGSLSPFDTGSLPPLSGIQVGGDGSQAINSSLVGYTRTDQLFARVSYDVTSNMRAFAQLSYSETRNRNVNVGIDNKINNLTIFSGNAYLTPEQQAELDATNTESFRFSRQSLEQGGKGVDFLNESSSLMAGLEGHFSNSWSWRLLYSGGRSSMRAKHTRNPEIRRLFAALDAVRDSSGQIVCRVTITNPGLLDDCVPLNYFGYDNPSPEAIEWVFGNNSEYDVQNELHDIAATASGELFDLPAGTVSGAVGLEWRTSSMEMHSNADPAIPIDLTGIRGVPVGQGRFGASNQGVADGKQDVREAFTEVVVPLLKDVPLADEVEFNGAFRVTDYSTSGRVETWKAGLSYNPIPDLRLRGTLSRDIRAPSLNELFAGKRFTPSAFTDIHTGIASMLSVEQSGNPDLVPEIGKTQAIGFVYQPSWLDGFSAAVDYYDIKISGAIASQTTTQLNLDCENSGGTVESCSYIIRPGAFSDRSPANAPTRIILIPRNLASVRTRGLDVDTAYRFPLGNLFSNSDATITLRFLLNYAPRYTTQETATAPVREQAGLSPNPKLRMTSSLHFEDGPLSLALQQRFIGGMKRSLLPTALYVQNDLPSIAYYNLSGSYDFEVGGLDLEMFMNVNNLFDKDPPLVPDIREPGLIYPTVQGVYDVIGRYYTAGVRFKF